MYSVDYKKGCAKQNHPLRFCESVVLDSIKRSANNIRRSMLDVRCSTFKAYSPPGGFAVPASQSFIRAPPLTKKTASLIKKETLQMVKV